MPDIQASIVLNRNLYFLVSFSIIAISTIWQIIIDWLKSESSRKELQTKNMQSELKFLKSQINPHFLFNTLNNLYALTLKKSDLAPEIVLKLSEIMRYMLYECNAAEVSLSKEIAFMKNYIGLEQLRYGDRLDMSLHISGDWENKQMAPLLLVPFVENAFKHGTSQQLEQAWMHIELMVQGNTLKFKLINSRDIDAQPTTDSGGIGLQNVKKRLQLLYANRHDLRLVAEDETFMVVLTLELTQTVADPTDLFTFGRATGRSLKALGQIKLLPNP